MPKYYVAGIPFDSEDCLKHYGVKGMKWNQHIFGIDANDKYINWLKDAGQNIGKFANKAANAVGNAATSAARAAGGALNKSANFVTGNQARENLNNAKANVANVQSGRSKVNDAYARYDQLRNSEAQHRTAANGWRESQANRAPLENFGRNQDRINADNEDRRANRDANRAEIAKMKADRMAERQRNAETQARAEAKNAQQAYDRTLPGAAENVARGAQGFLNSAGKWVSTAAGNAAKGVSNAANQAGQWVGDRANDVGKAATNAYNDVSKAVSGNGVEADVSERIAKKYGLNSVEDVLAMDRATAEKMLQEYDAEVSKAKDNSLFGRIGNTANAVGNWVGDRAKDVGNVATDAWNGVTDAANQAGDWIGDRARDVGNGVSDAANQAGQWIGDRANDVGKAAGSAVNAVGNAANDAGQWIGDRARDVGNWFTGGDKGQQAADLREQAKALQERGDAMADQGVRGISDSIYAEPPVNMSPDNSAYAQSAKDNSEAMFQKGLSTRNQGYDLQDDASALRNQAAHLQSAYDAAPRQQLRAGAEAVGNAASNAVNAIGNAANDVGKAAGSAVNAVGNAANSAANWVSDRALDIGDTVLQRARQQAADDHSQAVQNAYERVAEKYGMDLNKHPVLWDKNAYSELERELEQAYSDYSKRLEDIEKHPVGNAVGSLFHSELDNRPEGVGETFWQNYIAHGGTREDYERDWR